MKRPARLSSSPSTLLISALMASFHASAATSPSEAEASVIIVCTRTRVLFIEFSEGSSAEVTGGGRRPQNTVKTSTRNRPRESTQKFPPRGSCSAPEPAPVLGEHVAEERALRDRVVERLVR